MFAISLTLFLPSADCRLFIILTFSLSRPRPWTFIRFRGAAWLARCFDSAGVADGGGAGDGCCFAAVSRLCYVSGKVGPIILYAMIHDHDCSIEDEYRSTFCPSCPLLC